MQTNCRIARYRLKTCPDKTIHLFPNKNTDNRNKIKLRFKTVMENFDDEMHGYAITVWNKNTTLSDWVLPDDFKAAALPDFVRNDLMASIILSWARKQ